MHKSNLHKLSWLFFCIWHNARWISLMFKYISISNKILNKLLTFLPWIAKKYSLIIISVLFCYILYQIRPCWFFKLIVSRNGSSFFVENCLLLSNKVAKILVILVFTSWSSVHLFTFLFENIIHRGRFCKWTPSM